MHLAERMSRLGTESAFDVLVRARALEAQGRHVVHLEIGEPDFTTPEHIIEAAVAALRAGETHYTPTAGIPQLREAIANYTSETRGVQVGPERVVVTPGGKPIMFFVILALAGHGDEVIYPNPGFPIYESVINFSGATAVPLTLREEREFSFDPDELESLVTDRTRLVIINSPHNPTGGMIPTEALERLAKLAVERDFVVLSDEIYSRIVYAGVPDSIIRQPGMLDRTVILDGFSKTYAMTGWRMGYGVMPVWLAEQVTRLAVNVNSCTPGFSQLAAVAALTGPQDAVDAMVAEFRRRRDVMVAGLNAIPGISCLTPNGAFYVFPNVSALGADSRAIATKLLDEGGVALLWGSAFGAAGEGYLRLSYANSLENIEEALMRIRRTVETMV
ncbi:MAG: aspartate aminotransferase [Chloroflexi bacterium]|nr:MAG: aspartate aminotransferase [Chloroflexota bacterium]